MLILDANLNGIEEFLHRIVEDTEIRPPPNDILIDDLYLIVKLVATFVKIVEKMLVLVIFIVVFVAA
jgi:hypothetical protein